MGGLGWVGGLVNGFGKASLCRGVWVSLGGRVCVGGLRWVSGLG